MKNSNYIKNDRDISTDDIKRGILWKLKLIHSGYIQKLIAISIIWGFVFQVFSNPIVAIVFLSIIAAVTSSKFAGGDLTDGTEEFSFSLPITRAQQYTFPMIHGLILITTLAVVTFLSTCYSLPTYFWGLFTDGVYAQPYNIEMGIVPWLIILLPISTYIISYGFIRISKHRSREITVHMFTLVIIGISFFAIHLICDALDMMNLRILLNILALSALSATIWLLSFNYYKTKEPNCQIVVSRSSKAWIWVIIIIIIVIVLMGMFLLVDVKRETVEKTTLDQSTSEEK